MRALGVIVVRSATHIDGQRSETACRLVCKLLNWKGRARRRDKDAEQ
jgi:hypothetical protein